MAPLVDLNGNILVQETKPKQVTGIVDRFGQPISSKPILEMKPSENMDVLIKRYGNLNASVNERQAVTDAARKEYQSAQKQYQKALAKHQKMVKLHEESQARIQKLTLNSTSAEVKEAYGKLRSTRIGVEKSSAELSRYAEVMNNAQVKVNEAAVESMKFKNNLGKLRQDVGNAAVQNVGRKLSTTTPVSASVIDARLGIGREAVSAADSASAFIERGVTVQESLVNKLADQAENIAKNDGVIAQQGAKIAEQGSKIAEQGSKIAEQGSKIEGLAADVASKEGQIAEIGAKLAKSGKLNKLLTGGIIGLAVVGVGLGIWALLNNRKKNEQIASQQQADADNQAKINDLEQQLTDCQEQQEQAAAQQAQEEQREQEAAAQQEQKPSYVSLAEECDVIWNHCAEQLKTELKRTPTHAEIQLTTRAYMKEHNIPLINNYYGPLYVGDTLYSIPKLPEIFGE